MNEAESESAGQTPPDADGLLIEIRNQKELDEAEAEGILRARAKHLRIRHRKPGWLSAKLLLALHRDMFEGIWAWAGQFRDKDFKPNIGIPFYEVPAKVEELCRDAAYWAEMKTNPMTVLEQAVRIHHKLVAIHPFRNGNGRHSRLASDILLHAHTHAIPRWPYGETFQKGHTRAEYVSALKAADAGDYSSLIVFTEKHIPQMK
jgi:Fic-DOC domain mobile mystery protein B